MLFVVTSTTSGQNLLDKCYIDENTGDTIMTTYWKNLHNEPDLLINFRLVRINSTINLELKFHIGPYGAFSISDTNSLWLKISSDNTIKLKTQTNAIAKRGGAMMKDNLYGATVHGLKAEYFVPRQDCLTLQSEQIQKIRIFCSEGHFNAKISSTANLISNDFRLISNVPTKIKRITPEPDKPQQVEEPW
jgi:hypothetical protein